MMALGEAFMPAFYGVLGDIGTSLIKSIGSHLNNYLQEKAP